MMEQDVQTFITWTHGAQPTHARRGMSGMDIRDVRLVQVIHGGISNWLLRPLAHG